MRVLIQPYYFWSGHYKEYTNSLHKNNTICIASSFSDKSHNKINLKPLFVKYRKNILLFMFSRIFNSLNTIRHLNKYIFKNYLFHFVEFEPFSKIFYLSINTLLRKKTLFTIHSTGISKSNNIINNLIKLIQRVFFIIALLFSNLSPCRFVVHNQFNKNFIKYFVLKGRVTVIPYPTDIPIKKKLYNKNNKILVFGQFREDKGIIKILKKYDLTNFKIVFAGKFYDNQLLTYLKKFNNFKIINKFITEKQLISIASQVNFFLIPYSSDYSGSAGPMKKGLALGCPVIAPNTKVFYEIIGLNKLGYFLDGKIYSNLKKLKKKEYLKLSKKCLLYSKKNNWDNFLSKYKKVYKLFNY